MDGTAGGEDIHVDLTTPPSPVPLVRLGITINDDEDPPLVGTFKLLLWSAGRADRHIHSLRGGSGVACLGAARDDDAFIYTARDFRGTATIMAGTGPATGARAAVDTSRSIRAQRTLVGSFFGLVSSTDELAVDTPNGRRSCPCDFGSFVQDTGTPFGPGDYTFMDFGGVGLGGNEGEIVLAVIDAGLAGFTVPAQGCTG